MRLHRERIDRWYVVSCLEDAQQTIICSHLEICHQILVADAHYFEVEHDALVFGRRRSSVGTRVEVVDQCANEMLVVVEVHGTVAGLCLSVSSVAHLTCGLHRPCLATEAPSPCVCIVA